MEALQYNFEDEAYEKHRDRSKEVINEALRPGFEEACYFVDLGLLKSRLRLFQEHFMPEDPNRVISYAMKANPEGPILKTLVENGIDGFDCASIPEIRKILSIDGMGPENVFYNNPIRSQGDTQIALANGVRYFTVQSRSGIKKILGKNMYFELDDLEIAVRIETLNPDAKINLSTKFGCSPEEGIRLIKRVKDAGLKAGLAVHTGSQNRNPQTFEAAVELLKTVAEKSGGVSSINVGGGFPVNYLSSMQFDVRGYLDTLTQAVNCARSKIADESLGSMRPLIEPGRAIVAPIAELVVPILEMDVHRNKKRIYMNDGFFTSFLSTLVHDWQYEFDALSKDGRALTTPSESYVLHGRTCDSGDSLGEVKLPGGLKEGDCIYVRYAGAYMDCQATKFNGFNKAKYVFYE